MNFYVQMAFRACISEVSNGVNDKNGIKNMSLSLILCIYFYSIIATACDFFGKLLCIEF